MLSISGLLLCELVDDRGWDFGHWRTRTGALDPFQSLGSSANRDTSLDIFFVNTVCVQLRRTRFIGDKRKAAFGHELHDAVDITIEPPTFQYAYGPDVDYADALEYITALGSV